MKDLIKAAYGWLSQWAWVLIVAVLVLAAIVLPVLKWLAVIAWPWWAVLIPVYVLIGLFCWALAGLNSLLSEGWH